MIYRKIFRNTLIALMVSISALSFFNECSAQESADAWMRVRTQLDALESKKPLTLDELKDKNSLLKLEYDKRQIYFNEVADHYIAGDLVNDDIDLNFKSHPKYQKYMAHFSSILLMKSVKRLEEAKIQNIQVLMKRYALVYGSNWIPLFRITGSELNRQSPTQEKGGFHRGSKSIFMDITRVSSGEWLFVLMHELYHALDDNLNKATEEFANESLVESVKKMSQKKSKLFELTEEEMRDLDRYVTAGLNRNLFAEYRAWSLGFSVYAEGVEKGLWKKIPFIENVLSYKDKSEPMNSFIYRYLNERAGLSNDNFLSRPIIRDKIAEKREQFDPK